MRRVALVALAVAPLAARAQQLPDFDKVQIKVHPVAGAIYMLEGAGGNIAVSAGDDGLVVVDDQYAPLAEKIRAALKGIADKPVRFVINTHWHGDHTGGNAAMAGDGATILAHDNVRRRMTTGGQPGNLGTLKLNEVKPYPPVAQSLEQLQKERVLARWENQKRSFMNIDLFTESVYNELSGKKVGMNAPTPRH